MIRPYTKETSKLDNLQINYVMNYENVSCYELHRLHTIECILWVHVLHPAPTSIPHCTCHRSPFMYIMNVLNSHLFCAGKGRAQALRSQELES